jgi:branched-chain amino acid transport system substrate-binding protein
MKKLLLLALSAGLAWFVLKPQWHSFESMGERRFKVLSLPQKELLVGVVWPFAVNQDGMADGLQLAREEINADRLAGRPVRLVLRDPGLNWEEAKQVAMKFSDTPEMSAVLGYYDDSQGIKASAMFESCRLLHLIVGANDTQMTAHGFQYIVRTIVSSDKIARSLARMSVDRGHRKVAVLWEEDAYGEDLAYQYRVALDALDAEVVYQWSYSRERADFRMPVNELKNTDADTIFFAGLEPWAGDFVRMARGVGLKTEIVGAFSDTPEMRARAGPALEGAMYFNEYDVNEPSPENQEFVRRFRARYSRDPDTWAAQGYDALYLLARAVHATSSLNPLDLSYAIRFMDPWDGANGRYKFDNRGELDDKPIYLNVYRNGKPAVFQKGHPVPEPRVQ